MTGADAPHDAWLRVCSHGAERGVSCFATAVPSWQQTATARRAPPIAQRLAPFPLALARTLALLPLPSMRLLPSGLAESPDPPSSSALSFHMHGGCPP